MEGYTRTKNSEEEFKSWNQASFLPNGLAGKWENLSPKSTVNPVSDPLNGEGDTHMMTMQLVSPLTV